MTAAQFFQYLVRMQTLTLDLPQDMIDFAHQQVQLMGLESTDAFFLSLLQQHEQATERLNKLLDEGEASPLIEDFDRDEFLQMLIDEDDDACRRAA